MVVARKIITSALVELEKVEPTTRDKWLTVDAWEKLIWIHYDFVSTIDFSIGEFNRALNLLGAIRLKVSQETTPDVNIVPLTTWFSTMTSGDFVQQGEFC